MPNREPVYQLVATDSPPRTISTEAGTSEPLETKDMSPKKNWQVHPGRNKFCCDGRFMMGKQLGIFYLTLGLIIVGMGFFFGFDAPYLWKEVNPILPILAVLLTIFVMSTLFRTAFSDPGVIPRATPEEAAFIERGLENEANAPGYYRGAPRTKEVCVKGQMIKLKFCLTCKIFRPPRASHCSICDNCVERFDHHCPWVGNCVGLRNYKYFYLFLLSITVLCIYVFACTVAHLVLASKEGEEGSFLNAIKSSPGSVVVLVIDVISFLTIVGLMGFHSYLIATAQTTNEDIKGSFSSRRGQDVVNPYSYGGGISNCCHVLCGPVQPSTLHLQDEVQEVNQPDSRPDPRSVNGGAVTETANTITRHVPANNSVNNSIQSEAQHQGYSPYSNSFQPSRASGGLRNTAGSINTAGTALQPEDKYPTTHYNANPPV